MNIAYIRDEFHNPPQPMENPLSIFVYDIPYFGACGIFPPFHIINQIFKSGGGSGGMSSGASWKPFQISEGEYLKPVDDIKTVDPETLKDKARYAWFKLDFDHDFDAIEKWEEWLLAVCARHRENYNKKLKNMT